MAGDKTRRDADGYRWRQFAPEELVVTVFSEIDHTLISDQDQRAIVCLKGRANVEVGHAVPSHGHPIPSNGPYLPANPRAGDFAAGIVEIHPDSFRRGADHFGKGQCARIRKNVFQLVVDYWLH